MLTIKLFHLCNHLISYTITGSFGLIFVSLLSHFIYSYFYVTKKSFYQNHCSRSMSHLKLSVFLFQLICLYKMQVQLLFILTLFKNLFSQSIWSIQTILALWGLYLFSLISWFHFLALLLCFIVSLYSLKHTL